MFYNIGPLLTFKNYILRRAYAIFDIYLLENETKYM